MKTEGGSNGGEAGNQENQRGRQEQAWNGEIGRKRGSSEGVRRGREERREKEKARERKEKGRGRGRESVGVCVFVCERQGGRAPENKGTQRGWEKRKDHIQTH